VTTGVISGVVTVLESFDFEFCATKTTDYEEPYVTRRCECIR
jgi:hypothetical protein